MIFLERSLGRLRSVTIRLDQEGCSLFALRRPTFHRAAVNPPHVSSHFPIRMARPHRNPPARARSVRDHTRHICPVLRLILESRSDEILFELGDSAVAATCQVRAKPGIINQARTRREWKAAAWMRG
jgi:hypothetical protein